ncbi:MAG: transketolase [Bacteroidota bacterium]|nr:transketolase [Bacteroidota bacterium]
MNRLDTGGDSLNSPPLSSLSLEALKIEAVKLRIDILRMLNAAGSGHPGGSLSIVDILTVLFARHIRRVRPGIPDPERDRFVLSKGHGVPALYAVFARLGIIPREELLTLRKLGTRLQGHPHNGSLPYVEASTGSLGQGVSIAQGMALAARLDKSERRVYTILGDGEIQEGQMWEAFLSAAKYRLDNLIAILDYNKGQIDGFTSDVMNIDPVTDKLVSFGWEVQRIDGHDFPAIDAALEAAKTREGRPHFIVADTVKGKGVSFMEHNAEWHGKAPNDQETAAAVEELEQLLIPAMASQS